MSEIIMLMERVTREGKQRGRRKNKKQFTAELCVSLSHTHYSDSLPNLGQWDHMLEQRFGSRRLGWCVQVVWGEQREPSFRQQMGFKAADLVLVSKQ